MKRIVYAVITYTILLFLWSGFTQILPWGIPSAQKISVQSKENSKEIPNLIYLKPNTLTTDYFDKTFNHKISTYTTNDTFSWIITQPLQTDYSGYFIKELITQFFVAILLTILLILTIKLELKTKLTIILVVGILIFSSTYLQLMNWWGLPARYALGVGANLIFGWSFSSFIVSKYILKNEEQKHKKRLP